VDALADVLQTTSGSARAYLSGRPRLAAEHRSMRPPSTKKESFVRAIDTAVALCEIMSDDRGYWLGNGER